MCRLFGMSGGREPVRATFWLLEAPDSLARQSRREPDGTGLGTFDVRGRPVVSKQPIAAYKDQQFAEEAREVSSRTFIAHVRYASTGAVKPENTHPFEQRGRLFAHNGVVEGLDRLEGELGDAMSLVQGDTDSERFFALITREIEAGDGVSDVSGAGGEASGAGGEASGAGDDVSGAGGDASGAGDEASGAGGDVSAAIVRAVGWIAENLPVFALNVILISVTELWALRYPDVHKLYVLERDPGGPSGRRHMDHASARGSMRVRAGELATRPAVVLASEPMDEDPGWRLLEPGELVHVDPDLHVTSSRPLDRPPAHQLTLEDLEGKAAASQAPA